jgi:hypothetical protein
MGKIRFFVFSSICLIIICVAVIVFGNEAIKMNLVHANIIRFIQVAVFGLIVSFFYEMYENYITKYRKAVPVDRFKVGSKVQLNTDVMDPLDTGYRIFGNRDKPNSESKAGGYLKKGFTGVVMATEDNLSYGMVSYVRFDNIHKEYHIMIDNSYLEEIK